MTDLDKLLKVYKKMEKIIRSSLLTENSYFIGVKMKNSKSGLLAYGHVAVQL